MKNFNVTWKTVPLAVLLVGFIGFRVWMSMPGYRAADSGSASIQPGESWYYQFEVSDRTKLRFTVEAEAESGALDIFLADQATYDTLTAGDVEAMEAVDFLAEAGALRAHEHVVSAGKHVLHVEPASGGDPVNITYKIEAYLE